MSLSARERQVLDSIEHGLAYSDPKLAALLATFTKLAAGEEMPVRERLQMGWRRTSGQLRSPQRQSRCRRPGHGTGHRLGGHVLMLLCLLVSVTLATVVVVGSHGGKPACQAPLGLVCAVHASWHGAAASVP